MFPAFLLFTARAYGEYTQVRSESAGLAAERSGNWIGPGTGPSCGRAGPPGTRAWWGQRARRARGPYHLPGRSGEFDRLWLPSRETEAGRPGDSSCRFREKRRRRILALRALRATRAPASRPPRPLAAAGLRKCVWARPGPRARGRSAGGGGRWHRQALARRRPLAPRAQPSRRRRHLR